MSSEQSWTIRPVNVRDVEIIAKHRYSTVVVAEIDIKNYAEWVATAITNQDYLGLVAESGGEIIAGAGVTILDWGPTLRTASSLRGRVVNVFTASVWRRKGIASQMLTQIFAEARRRGVASFCLGATEEGRALYQSLGFIDCEREMVLR